MGMDCELGLAGNGVLVKVEQSEGENIESLCRGGAGPVKVEQSEGEIIESLCRGGTIPVKVEESEGESNDVFCGVCTVPVKVDESEGEEIESLCEVGRGPVKVESGAENIGLLCVSGGVVVKIEECEVGNVGVIGDGIVERGDGVNDAETFSEREIGRFSLGCLENELDCGGCDGIGGRTETEKIIFGTRNNELDVINGEGVSVKTELDVDEGVVCSRDVVIGGDGVRVMNELACGDGEMDGDSIVIGGTVVASNETLCAGQQACEDVQGKDTREGERGHSSNELASSSSTSDDNSDDANEADDEFDGTEMKRGGVKADVEKEEGEIREFNEQAMPEKKDFTGSEEDDNDANKMIDWSGVENKTNGDVEKEEGEIREADEQAMPDKKDFTESEEDDNDANKMIDWSGVENETNSFEAFSISDDENEVIAGPIMSKNELKVLPLVPSVCVKLESHHEMVPIGPVLSIVELQVVVEGCLKHNPLSEGSILWIAESRSPLGFVEEIFGPVKNPFYLIRYNSKAEIPAGVIEGTLVSSVPEYANYVLNQKDLHKKGYDLSGKNDEEVSEEEEFSDDEKEAEYKRMQRMAKRDTEMNAEKLVNKKARKKKDSGRNSSWKSGPSTQPVPTLSQVQLNINHDHPPTRPAPMDGGNNAYSSAIRPELFGGNNEVPPFPLQMPNGGNSVLPFNPSLLNGLPFQGPTGPGLLNAISCALLPANNGQFRAQTAQFPVQTAQFPAQLMVPPSQVPFQLGYNPSQNILANLVPHGVQLNPFGDPASAPWSGPIPQNSFNPSGIGMLDPNNLLLFANALGIHLSGGQNGQNFNAIAPSPAPVPPASAAIPPPMQSFGQFNSSASSGPGHRPFRRGRGRFSGGRGRGQFN